MDVSSSSFPGQRRLRVARSTPVTFHIKVAATALSVWGSCRKPMIAILAAGATCSRRPPIHKLDLAPQPLTTTLSDDISIRDERRTAQTLSLRPGRA
jgi:hypothetical protein